MQTAVPDHAIQTIISFIESLNIPVKYEPGLEGVFLPGLRIGNGAIIIDPGKMLYPGDLLHEAGHLAVIPPEDRATLSNEHIRERKDYAAEEMMAIAWSYAACCHLQLDPRVVFHDNGYGNGGAEIAENFVRGNYFGVPMLQWIGLANDPQNKNLPEGAITYPQMLKWLRT